MEEQNKPQPIQMSFNENNLGIIAHLLGLFTSFIGPLVMYLLYKETATEKLKSNIINTLNWQISLAIYLVISLYLVISFVLTIIIVGALGLFVFSILNMIFSILGAIEANKGNVYKYPITINFIK
jgi:uncharacterized Tic20 family protein